MSPGAAVVMKPPILVVIVRKVAQHVKVPEEARPDGQMVKCQGEALYNLKL